MIDFLAGVPGKLATIYTHLTTYLSSTRAAKIDNLDTTISSRAAASTALSNATWTNAKADYLDMPISGVARIKSIQHLNITILYNQTTGDATISPAVNTAKSIIILRGMSCSDKGPDMNNATVHFLNGSTLQAGRRKPGSTADDALYVKATVVEFY